MDKNYIVIFVYSYDANGNKTSETDPNGNVIGYEYDALNRMTEKIQDPDGLNLVTAYEYDSVGNRTSITDANENRTDYEYDELNHLIMVTDAHDGETKYEYDGCGNKTAMTDANLFSTIYEYDGLNRLFETIDPLGNSITYDYDSNGNRIWQNDGNENIIDYEYDELNRLERRTFPGGKEVSYTYDTNGNRLTMQGSSGLTTYHYDELNRLDWTTQTDDKTISYTYDPNSNRLSMDSSDSIQPTQYPVYDELNRLKEIVDPQGGVTTYEYDPGSRMISMTYPNETEATYEYDNANRLLSQITEKSDGETVITSFEYTHDNVGNRLTMIDLGETTSYQYDDLYRLTSVTYPDTSSVTYIYDAVGNRLSQTDSGGNITAYDYNAANELVYISPDFVSSTITVSGDVSDLDENGDPTQLASVTVNNIPAEIVGNTFTAQNVPANLGDNQITAVATDLAGNVSQDDITVHITKAGDNFIELEYDGNGNLISKDDQDQITTYEYDYANRLIIVTLPDSSTNKFTYDGDKRRISKEAADGTVTKFLYDGINILHDLDSNGDVIASYVQGIGIDKLICRETNEGRAYYHSDAIGSVRSLTDEDEIEVGTHNYDAWGEVTSETGSLGNEYKFTSRRWEDEIGLQYNRARFYDPEIGRFITRDPLTGGPDDPTISYFSGVYSAFHRFIKEYVDALQPDKQNRYVYCYNNPINLIDPLGLSADEDATAEVKVEAEQAETGQREEEKAEQPQTTGTEQGGQTAGDVAEEEIGFDWDKTRPTVPKLSEIQAEREQGKLAEQRERMSGHDKRSMEKNLAKARERALRKQGLATGAYESWKQFGISGVRKGGFAGWLQRVAATAMMTSIDFFGARSVEMNAGRTGWAVGMGDTGEALWYGGLTVGQIALEATAAAGSLKSAHVGAKYKLTFGDKFIHSAHHKTGIAKGLKHIQPMIYKEGVKESHKVLFRLPLPFK